MKNIVFYTMAILLLMPNPTEAQFWKELRDKTKDKISERLVDKVENEISEDLANRAMKNVDKLYENLWRKSYNDANGEALSEEEFGEMITDLGDNLNEALGELNKVADVPDRYDFNIIVDYTSTDEFGEVTKSEMYFSRTEGIMGISVESDNKQTFMVMDAENDLMVIYNENNGSKTAQAIPAMFTMATALSMTSTEALEYRMPMQLTGGTKSIAGYNSKEYKGENDESAYTIYMSSEMPFDWRDSYGELIKSVIPQVYEENEQKFEGMMMQIDEKNKKTGKTSQWKVNKVSQLSTSIIKSEYEFTGVQN